MKIGYFNHWFQKAYSVVELWKAAGHEVEQVDYSRPGYLDKFDVVIIDQNGFNDYIENDQTYIWEYVERGGVLFFMAQDFCRWAPGFLPRELGHNQLIFRHVPTLPVAALKNSRIESGEKEPFRTYMMPSATQAGEVLFSHPENIGPEELLDWHIPVNTFSVLGMNPAPEKVRTAALSCFIPSDKMEILASYQDPGTRNGALLMQYRYGKGLFFMSQILFPEADTPQAAPCVAFWKKFIVNLADHFHRTVRDLPAPALPAPGRIASGKPNYSMCIHMHSLDWYGADASFAAIRALLRKNEVDICGVAVKYADEKLNPSAFSDDRVMFLDGQEYHPFNWEPRNDNLHNCYHILALGIDQDAYTEEFTRSFYTEQEIDRYLKRALDYIHQHGGVAVATHPWEIDYWKDYPYDAVDMEYMTSMEGKSLERYYLSGGRIAVLNSVDLFGIRMFYANPSVNFIYFEPGETPSRDAVSRAVKAGRTIAGCHFQAADIRLNGQFPGTVLKKGSPVELTYSARVRQDAGTIRELRVYGDAEVIWRQSFDTNAIAGKITLPPQTAEKFLRVEISGETELVIVNTTPWYLE